MNPKNSGVLFGALFAAMGLGIYLMVHLAPDGARAPVFVVEAAAGAFFFAGVSVIGQALGITLLSRIASLAVVYLLAVPGLWMLLDGNSGGCSVGIAIAGAGLNSAADPALCRAVFGIGGLITLAVALLFTWTALKTRRTKADPDASA